MAAQGRLEADDTIQKLKKQKMVKDKKLVCYINCLFLNICIWSTLLQPSETTILAFNSFNYISDNPGSKIIKLF